MSLFRNEHVHVAGTSRIDMSSSAVAQYAPKIPTHVVLNYVAQNAAQAVSATIFHAPNAANSLLYGAYKVVDVKVSVGQVSDATGSVDVVQAADATAIGSGTTVLSAAVNTNTITAATATNAALSTNNAALLITPGNRLGVKFAGTQTNLLNECVTIVLERV